MRLLNKIRRKIINTFEPYDKKDRIQQVVSELSKLSLNFEDGDKELTQTLKNSDLLGYRSQDVSSNHWQIFANINSVYNGTDFKNILEIGTYDGITTTLLATIFKNAKTYTVDLPDNDEMFLNTYNRESSSAQFILKRDRILKSCDNIIQVQQNSFCLTFLDKLKFDLVWVDGAHGYPTVVSDIINAYRLLKVGGFLMVDDVITEPLFESDGIYFSEGAHATLEELLKMGAFKNWCLPLKRADILSNDKIFNNKKIFVGEKANKVIGLS